MGLAVIRHSPRRAAALALLWSLAGLTIGWMAAPLLLASQRPWRRAAAEGVISLQISPDGRLQLLGRPLDRRQLDQRLQQARRQPGWRAVRLLPAPGVPWGRVLQLRAQLEQGGWPVELQLPSP